MLLIFNSFPKFSIFPFDDDDQVAMLNRLITDCVNSINIHALLKRVKLTRPIARWMHDPKIIKLQKELVSQ